MPFWWQFSLSIVCKYLIPVMCHYFLLSFMFFSCSLLYCAYHFTIWVLEIKRESALYGNSIGKADISISKDSSSLSKHEFLPFSFSILYLYKWSVSRLFLSFLCGWSQSSLIYEYLAFDLATRISENGLNLTCWIVVLGKC